MSFWQKANEWRDRQWDRLYQTIDPETYKSGEGKSPEPGGIRKSGVPGSEAADDFIRKWSGQETYYEEQAREENDRYWADYYKNTGINPKDVKYPIRAGMDMNNPGQQIPMMGISSGKRAITELYGGQR